MSDTRKSTSSLTRLILLLLTLLPLPLQAAEPQNIDDDAIVRKLTTTLNKNKLFDDAVLIVESERGFILLAGQVSSEEAKTEATRITAFNTPDLRRLINQLEVVASPDGSTADADTALQERIVSLIKSESPALAESVVPVVHKAVVYLMGGLTREDSGHIAQLVSQVSGVANVVLAFEQIQ